MVPKIPKNFGISIASSILRVSLLLTVYPWEKNLVKGPKTLFSLGHFYRNHKMDSYVGIRVAGVLFYRNVTVEGSLSSEFC